MKAAMHKFLRHFLPYLALMVVTGMPQHGFSNPAGTLSGQDSPQALFNQGNFMLENRDFSNAIATYRQIEEMGFFSGPLFHNLAVCYLFADSLGLASYYFHRSARFRETSEKSATALHHIDLIMKNRGTFLPYLPWYAFVDWFLFRANLYLWAIGALLLLYAGVLLLLTAWLMKPAAWISNTGSTFAGTGAVLLVLTLLLSTWSQHYRMAVITDPQVVLHPAPPMVKHDHFQSEENCSDSRLTASSLPSETAQVPPEAAQITLETAQVSPDTAFDRMDLAHEGQTATLRITRNTDHPGWIHIRLRNGISGWVHESSLRYL